MLKITSASVLAVLLLFGGCITPGSMEPMASNARQQVGDSSANPDATLSPVQQTQAVSNPEAAAAASTPSTSLTQLEQASRNNPKLSRLFQEYQAALSRVQYVDELPDPQLAASAFVSPIETAAGSQRANLTLSQMIPWLPRLDAQTKQACLQAAALSHVYEAERLKVVADIRATWFRLYVLRQQIEINTENQRTLKTFIDVASSRVSTGDSSPGDVLAGTLEYSKLEEQVVRLRQQLVSTKTQLNRLVGRQATAAITAPHHIDAHLPDWDAQFLQGLARAHQPDIHGARIRQQATRWGVEVARLKRRPDITVSTAWFAIDDNRPTPSFVDVGEDAWSLGAMLTLPIRSEKYDAMKQEALWKHAAAHSSFDEIDQYYAALLIDLWEQAKAASETVELYRTTILPESERTLEADQAAYSNGRVEFDRVIQDFRNLLTLKLGYHRAIGELATAIARIQQAIGLDVDTATI